MVGLLQNGQPWATPRPDAGPDLGRRKLAWSQAQPPSPGPRFPATVGNRPAPRLAIPVTTYADWPRPPIAPACAAGSRPAPEPRAPSAPTPQARTQPNTRTRLTARPARQGTHPSPPTSVSARTSAAPRQTPLTRSHKRPTTTTT